MSYYTGTLKDEKGSSFYPYSAEFAAGPKTQYIYVEGNANTYYPVLLKLNFDLVGHAKGYRKINISRNYAADAPDSWNTTTHKGGLTLTLYWTGDSSWGGGDHTVKCLEWHERYSTMVANWQVCTTGLLLWLRGGGAAYWIDSEYGAALSVEIHYTEYTDTGGGIYSSTTSIQGDGLRHNIYPTFDMVYPVGSIYMSVNSTNPRQLFGGVWQQLQGRFLLGAGNNGDGLIRYVENTGGAALHTLTEDEMPSHTHRYTASGHYAKIPGWVWDTGGDRFSLGSTGYPIEDPSSCGGSQPHNNMPPFIVVYMWKRTS